MDYRALGKNIRKYHLLNGIRQEDLAERCNCSVSHIAHIEKGLGNRVWRWSLSSQTNWELQ